MTRVRQRCLVTILTTALLTTLLAVVTPTSANAAGTILFLNNFFNRTVDGTGTVIKPNPSSGTNAVCLTASGNTATGPLLSCTSSTDVQGSGKLRLTTATTGQIGGVFGGNSFPTSNGLDVTFNSYQYGGNAADGIAFGLAAVDPANPVVPTVIGPSGAALGYSSSGSVAGLTNAYLGVGIDVFGNFSGSLAQGSGCGSVTNITGQAPGAVVVRGPGTGTVGYCGLTTTYAGTVASRLTLRATTRAAAVVPVQVLINPSTVPFTSETGQSAAPGTYKVIVTPVGGTVKTLAGPLPTVPSTLYPSTSWLNSAGVPKQLAFGFFGSTGSVTDFHEISNVKVLTFTPVPQLAVSATSYNDSTPSPGEPVNYIVSPSVSSGVDEASAVSVTQTTPAGVVPVGAYGTGWVCAAPAAQSITCTTSATSFTNGTVLPNINVVATVTGSSVTSASIQNSSVTTVSSADASPVSLTTMTAGTTPTAPSGVTISPALSTIAGGGAVTVRGTNITAATAIEIGTAAEQAAGTSVVLLPCPSGVTVGCFTVSGATLVIPSMPSRSTAANTVVTVVTLGVAGATSYVYVDKPATPDAPTATAAITSATVSWIAPANNGGAITSYILTPYLNNVAQTPITYDTSTTTRTLTGLVAGGSYTYTIAAVNAYGTSTASAKSTAVIPYALPAAPTTPTASAGTQAATLTWATPANNGAAITGYVVTPYIGATAQTALTFNSTATSQTLTGLTAGTAYTFTVAAINLAGTGPPSPRSAAVTPNAVPTLTFAAPPSGEVGVAYSQQLTVNNGTSPFAWSISSGSLPAGITVNAATGLLSGTPTAAGNFTFTVQVTDASSVSATRPVTLVIAAVPVVTFTPAAGEVSVPYSQQPTLTGGTSPIAWSITAGSLPAGLTLNASTGAIAGTPTASGSFSVTIAATDAFNQVASRTVTIVIAALPTLTFTAPVAGQIGVAYSTSFDVSGGTAPLVWSVVAGSLPPGLTLNTGTGVLSGTPSTAGGYSFTVRVADAYSKSDTKAVTVNIGAGPLVINKTANVSSTVVGATVSYTITITNSSIVPFLGVTISDPLAGVLDDATYNANAAASTGTVSYASSTLTWTGNVAGTSTVTITYSVTVNNPDVGNKVLSNTVTTSTLGSNCPSGSSDTRCTATVPVAGLTIVKTASVVNTTPGGVVSYRIVVTNSGQTAYSGATLTDSLAGVLDDAAYNNDGTATAGSVSFSSPSLTWTGNLAIGASATITYSVTVANPDTGNRTLTGTVVSPTAGSSCPGGNPAASCSTTVTVLIPALSISAVAGVGSSIPGGTVPYTLTISNTGQTPYTGAAVTLLLAEVIDDATYNNNAAASAGTVSYTPGTGNLVWTGDLAIGAVVTVTASVTVNNPDTANKALTAVAVSAAPGSTCTAGSSNPACTSSIPVLIPALTIQTSADVSTTTPGSVVHYTVSVTNTGQTPYTGATFANSLAGLLDDATYNGDATATSGAVSYASSTVTWTGNLSVAATATITYSVTVLRPDPGNLSLSSAVTSSTPFNNCVPGNTDVRCTNNVQVLIPALGLSIAASPVSTTPGSVVTYTVTAQNTGQTPYAGAAVTLDLSAVVDDAAYNNDASITTGNLVTNPDGTFTWVLSLATGASATGTLSVTVNSPISGDKSLQARVLSDVAGSNCPTAGTAPACVSTVGILIPGMTITKTANVTTATPGDPIQYTVLVVNTGETTLAGASFVDSQVTVLTDAIYAGDATATSGSVNYAAPDLNWTGTLAPGASATITYSVTVRDPDPGDKRIYNTVVSTTPGNNCPAGGVDPRCTVSVSVLVPGLTIAKSANVGTTAPGAAVSYSITVTNSGATAFTGATVTDSLAGVLDDATYNNNATATSGSVSYAGSALGWTGNLAVGASATITYSVTVHTADGGNNLLTNVVTSTARGNNCLSGSTDTRCTATVPVARLVLTQAYSAPTTTPGSLLRLNATFTNTGQVPYTGITVTSPSADTVDDAIPTGDQVASSGTLVLSPTAITWTGSIPVGGTVTVTGTLTVENPDPGNKIITGTLVSAAPGNNCPAGGSDPRCTALINVLIPALTISKTVSAVTTVAGNTVGYTITVNNTGQTPYTGATFTDSLSGLLDDATYNGNATATRGAASYGAPILTWTGDLAVGQSAIITYSVTVKAAGSGDTIMANSVASSTVGNTCPVASGNTACRTVVSVLTPDLTMLKTATGTTANLGSTVTYTIKVTNTGQTDYAAAAFTDSLSAVLDDANYGSGSATSGTYTYTAATSTVGWSGPLIVGASATITYSVTVRNPNPGNRVMTNTLVSSNVGANCLAASTDARCTAVVSVTNATTITIVNSSISTSTTAGTVVNYTTTMTNGGGLISGADLTISLADVLDDASNLTYNSTIGLGTLSYTAPNLTWSGGLLFGGSVTVNYSVTVANPSTGNLVLKSVASSTTSLGSNNCETTSSDPRCTARVPVAALVIERHWDTATTTPGSIITATATFTNTGRAPYTDISVALNGSSIGDDAIRNGDQTATSGTLTLSGTTLTWSGDIPVGGVVTVIGSFTVKDPDPGDKTIGGFWVSSAPGNNCLSGSTDPRCTATVAVLIPGLTITKTANTPFVVPGGTAGYTVTVVNSGQTAYTGAVVTDSLIGLLDDAVYNANATTTVGSVSYSAPVLTWTGNLAVGATATITYSVTALSPASGDKTMVNPVVSSTVGSTCPPASGNSVCHTTVAVLTPALTITSVASAGTALPGSTVTYTVSVTNSGQVPYAAATFTIPLAGVIDDATYNSNASATVGAVGVAANTLTWTGALAVGGASTISYSVTVNNPDTGDHLLTQTITSPTQGSTCPSGGTDPRCSTSVAIASLRLVNASDVTTTQPTGVVKYTGTFTNTGQVPYVGITVNVSFAGALDDATYNGDATADAGSLILIPGSGVITWTGDVPVGATVTVTGSVTVNNPDTGNKNLRTVLTTTAPSTNCAVGSTDTACTTNVTVLTPELTITKVANTTRTTPGTSVGYTLTIQNTGQTAYPAVTVTDELDGVLDDATYTSDAVADRGTITFGEPDLIWTGGLAIGQTAVITYSVVVDNPDLGDKLMVNRAVSDALGSSCPSTVSAALADANCWTQTPVVVPALDIAVTADRTTSTPSDTVKYTITARNVGETNYLAANVTTTLAGVLDDAAYNGDALATSGSVSYAAPALTWTGDLAVGGTVSITYSVTVANPDIGNRILSTAVSSTAPGSGCTPATPCLNTVGVLIPGLAVATTANVSSATPGDQVTFTISIANTGQTSYVGTTVGTSLAGVLDDATFDGVVNASSGLATYTAPNLQWTGTLAPGENVSINYTVTVKIPDTGNRVLSTTVVAPAAGSTCQAGSAVAACTANVTVLVPALSIIQTASTSTTTPGSVVGYTVQIANTGQTAYRGAVITDSLSGVLTDADYNNDAAVVVGGGVLNYAAPVLTWTGDLPVGASATVTFSITVHNPDNGDKLMSNTVVSPVPGSSCPPVGAGAACSTQVRVLIPALNVGISADRTTVVAGSAITYTITLTNVGETAYNPASFTNSLADVLDDASYAGDATASIGTVQFANNTLAWTGVLAVGATATISYSVTTAFPATGNLVVTSSVISAVPGSTCATTSDARCSSSVTILVPALNITKTADLNDVVAGGVVRYTISATNSGQAAYSAANLTDPLTGVLDDAVYNSDATATTGALEYSNGVLNWTGSLGTGDSVVITYSVTVRVTTTGDERLSNDVLSSSVGSSCVTAGANPQCSTSTAVSAQTLTLTGLTPSFTLTGLPTTTVGTDGILVMTVTTNSQSGYAVTVQPGSDLLMPQSSTNSDTIPFDNLWVRETGDSQFQQLDPNSSTVVHQQNRPSAPGGDAVSNDYQVDIPFVATDTYSGTLDYVVTTQ